MEKISYMAIPGIKSNLTADEIINCVQNYTGINLLENRRTKKVTEARYVAMYSLKNLTNLSLTDIGKAVGKKHHATVLHGIKLIEDLLQVDREFRNEFNPLFKKIGIL